MLERSKDAELFEKVIEVAESVENVESGKVLVTDKEAESEENIEVEKVLMTTKEELAIEKCEESDWETVEDSDGCENDFPAIDVSCDNWDKKFNESVKRYHNIVNCENSEKLRLIHDGLVSPCSELFRYCSFYCICSSEYCIPALN